MAGRSPTSPVSLQVRTASSDGGHVIWQEGVYPALYLLLECSRPTAGSLRISLRGVSAVGVGRGEQRNIARPPPACCLPS